MVDFPDPDFDELHLDPPELNDLKARTDKLIRFNGEEFKKAETKRRQAMEQDYKDNRPGWYDQDNAANSPLEATWDDWEVEDAN